MTQLPGGTGFRELPSLALTLRAWSLSSIWPRSLPLACAILFPDTRFPTITEAGPISRKNTGKQVNLQQHLPPWRSARPGETPPKVML